MCSGCVCDCHMPVGWDLSWDYQSEYLHMASPWAQTSLQHGNLTATGLPIKQLMAPRVDVLASNEEAAPPFVTSPQKALSALPSFDTSYKVSQTHQNQGRGD